MPALLFLHEKLKTYGVTISKNGLEETILTNSHTMGLGFVIMKNSQKMYQLCSLN